MRFGCTLPHMGRLATPENLVRAAQHAEAAGIDTLWVADRLLRPVHPRTPYPATPDGSLPDYFERVMDPLETLTFVAAHTKRVRLGTSILNMPFYNPVVLARRLATLDVLSHGRLRVGLGQAWSADELEAVGARPGERAARADEFIRVLDAMWADDPVQFQGAHFRVAPSLVGLKPVQRPRPPVYLAAYVPGALRRAATLSDGWLVSTAPFEAVAQLLPAFRELARQGGRDPDRLEAIYMGAMKVAPSGAGSGGAGRGFLSGSAEEVRDDVRRLRDLGMTELLWFGTEGATLDENLAALDRVHAVVESVR